MRNSFFNSLFEIAKKDKDIIVITADMGFSVLEPFRDELPAQFVNAGISEANAVTMAAGMSLLGKKVYVYSIVPFITFRCFEQIRIDVCYHNVNVKLIGVGGGLDYGQSGTTHHSTEDISVMRSLPNMSVVCPCDPLESAALPFMLYKILTPVYVRLGRGKEPIIHNTMPDFSSFSVFEICNYGNDIVVFTTGNIAYNVYKAVESLGAKQYSIKLIFVPWIKPFPNNDIIEKIKQSKLIVTIEEHSCIGGLRTSMLETMNDAGIFCIIHAITLPDSFQKTVGSQDYLRKLNGLDIESIEKKIAEWANDILK